MKKYSLEIDKNVCGNNFINKKCEKFLIRGGKDSNVKNKLADLCCLLIFADKSIWYEALYI